MASAPLSRCVHVCMLAWENEKAQLYRADLDVLLTCVPVCLARFWDAHIPSTRDMHSIDLNMLRTRQRRMHMHSARLCGSTDCRRFQVPRVSVSPWPAWSLSSRHTSPWPAWSLSSRSLPATTGLDYGIRLARGAAMLWGTEAQGRGRL